MKIFVLLFLLSGFFVNAFGDNTNPPNWTPPTAASVWDKAAYTQPTKAPTNTEPKYAPLPSDKGVPVIQPLQFPQASLQIDPNHMNLLRLAAGQSAEAQYIRDHTGLLDALSAAHDNEKRPLVNALARIHDAYSDPLAPIVDEKWLQERNANWNKYMAGYSSEETKNLLVAINQKDYERRVEQIKFQRDNNATLEAAGPTYSLIANALAFVFNPIHAAVILCLGFVLARVRRRKTMQQQEHNEPKTL